MTGGSESAAGENDGGTTLITQVPVGWQRKAPDGVVCYISPSGTVLRSVDEVTVYLQTDGTCKCGLECPLVLNKVFNFDPAAVVQVPGLQLGKIEEDMTKLCNHRRKVDAMAALCQSMQSPHVPPPAHATGGVVCSVESRGSTNTPHCTYTQPRDNQPKFSSISPSLTSPCTALQNGSVSHTSNSRPLEQSSPLKKPLCQTSMGSKSQWNPHLPLTQNNLQRTAHNSASLNHNLLHNYMSSCTSPTLTAPPGGSVKSPSPLSVCSSPSCTVESFSPHQCSQNSLISSLSEQGALGSVFIQGVKPFLPTVPCSSPRLLPPPTSLSSRLDEILQHYSTNTNSTISNNQSIKQIVSLAHPDPGDMRNGEVVSPLNSAQASSLLGRSLEQILSQPKGQQHLCSSFPASSLLSAAAKAQLANQKPQIQLSTADTQSTLSLTGLDKHGQSKVLISTLNSNLHPTSARAQSLTPLLSPHSPSLTQNSPTLTDKTLCHKRQRRSPTVLSMLKETQLSRATGGLSMPPLRISPSCSPSSPPIPVSDNHRLSLPPSNAIFPNSAGRLQEADESRKMRLANSLPFSSLSSSQPLSALLQLLSMQSVQNMTQQFDSTTSLSSSRHTHLVPSSPQPGIPHAPQCDGQPAVQAHTSQPQNPVPIHEPSTQLPLSQTFLLMGDETTTNLSIMPSSSILNLSQPHTGMPPDLNSSVLGKMNQMSSASCVSPHSENSCGAKSTEMCPDNNTYPINQPHQSNHSQAVDSKGAVETLDQLNSDTRLGHCDPDHSLSLSTADSAVSLPLTEAFPFMTQEQLLQLLASNPGLPSLLPPVLGSLPLGIWTNQLSAPVGTQQSQQPVLNQDSTLNMLGAQSELPLNLIGLLNPLVSAATLPAAGGVEGGEKPPGLQALLMASLLLGQNPTAMLPLPTLSLELPTAQQQVFPEGEKTPALLDSVLMGPGLLEALQTLAPPVGGHSLFIPAPLDTPPPSFLSLNPDLLAAALGHTESLSNHTSPPLHSQGSLSSPALVSTSVSCGPLAPPTGQEVCDPQSEQDKNSHTPHFLPPLLNPGVLSELTALGNMNSLHSLLGAGLLLPQGPTLDGPLTQNQTSLNPLTCLQLTMGPTLLTEKPGSPQSQEELPSAQISQDSLLPVQASTQQREGSGLFDPYGSFMNTIYTSFLQASERSESTSDSMPQPYPELPPLLQQASAPPAVSPRRACSVHNPDLTRLSMETAQSPARGTPKLSEDPSTPPPSKPLDGNALTDAPLQPAFMEEAKTDGSAKVCLHSNGISSEMEGGENNEDEDVGQSQSGYLSPREGPIDDITSRDAQQERTEDMHTGARRGRKRKQLLQRGTDLLINSIIEEPGIMRTLSRPVRSARGKKRRMIR